MTGARNATCRQHVLTVANPSEYLFKDCKSGLNQRELGIEAYRRA